MSKEKMFDSVYMEGYVHKFSCIKYDNNGKIRYLIGSFLSRQLLDNALSIIQKGCSMKLEGKVYRTFTKGYKCKALRVRDENKGDGIHAIIYMEDANTINVYDNDNRVDKVFEYLKANTQCGLLEEWKSYFYNELYSEGYIIECEGVDYTGKGPTVLVLNDIDTDLVRNIKAAGLRNGDISLPVDDVEEIDTSMTFLDIIEKLIIPNIEAEECHYNVGDPMSEIFKLPIINEETNTKKVLYPRQQVISQGMLNSIKNGIKSPVLCLGMGTGKTLQSTRIAYAVIKEHFKKENARLGIIMPSHLLNKWIREFKDSYYPLGIRPKFYVIQRFTDVDNLPEKPDGIEIVIFQKDITKRTYLHEYSGVKKHKIHNNIYEFLNSVETKYLNTDKDMIFENCKVLSLSEMKLAAIKMERRLKKKVILYKEQFNNNEEVEGFKVISTSSSIIKTFGDTKKAYNFYVKDINRVKDVATTLKESILKEEVFDEEINYDTSDPLICPVCGGPLYHKEEDAFDSENFRNYIKHTPNKMNSQNLKCCNYIKADGSNLSAEERTEIIKGNISIIYTNDKVKFPYVDADGNELKGDELVRAKSNNSYSILVRKCNHKLWGAKNQKGYIDYDSAKYFRKRFGTGSLHVLIADEVHQYANCSNQKSSFTHLCKCAKVILPLTGTLTGGKASDLFYLLWNLYPKKMIQLGFKYNELGRFIDMFGRRKRVTKQYLDTYNKSGTGRSVKGSWTEIPGISPAMTNVILSSVMVARTIDDMAIPMPKLRYIKHAVDMDDDLKDGYNKLKNDIVSFLTKNRGINVGGIYLNSLLSYPDYPVQEPLYALKDIHIATPTIINVKDRLLNKERKLIETIEKEIAEGRRVLVYSVFSGIKGVSKRLVEVLSKKFKVAELTSSIKLQKREEWIEKQYQKGIDCIITNPKCVETGLECDTFLTEKVRH